MGGCFAYGLNFVPLFVPPRFFAAIKPGLASSQLSLWPVASICIGSVTMNALPRLHADSAKEGHDVGR